MIIYERSIVPNGVPVWLNGIVSVSQNPGVGPGWLSTYITAADGSQWPDNYWGGAGAWHWPDGTNGHAAPKNPALRMENNRNLSTRNGYNNYT